jgi:hypothetical protein
MFLREDSRAHWLPTEVASSRAILEDSRPVNVSNLTPETATAAANPATSPTKDRNLRRSLTLSSFPTTLAQLTGMGHFLTRQESNRSVSEKDVVIERSAGIIRLGSADGNGSDGAGVDGGGIVVIDAPNDTEIRIDDKPSKRFTITGAVASFPFAPRSPHEMQKKRSRRRTVARGNSDGSSIPGSGGESPDLSVRKRPTAIYLSHSPSARSLGHVSSSRSILSLQDSPTAATKLSGESEADSSSGPSREFTLSTLQTETETGGSLKSQEQQRDLDRRLNEL